MFISYRFLLVLILSLFLFGCGNESESEKAPEPAVTINEFGLVVDSLQEVRGTVERNQTLTDILMPYGVSYQEIYNVAEASKDVFDITKIRSGNEYAVYLESDTSNTLKYFVYEESPVRYYVFNMEDSISVALGEKDVEVREAQISGIINGSLYQTLEENGASPLLAMKLSEVFAWQIDFYGIQAGDYFKVIYNEKYLEGDFMTIGKVKSAYFNHRDKGYYAFYFEEGENIDYFDEEGNSLRKAFLKAPLKFTRISSGYSNNRFHPVLKRYRAHHGIDYAAPTGTPIQAIGNGVIVERGFKRSNGNWIKIKHNGTYQSAYLHLSKFAKGIVKGASVRQGQVIGYVGSTGLASGPHLDFRFYINGQTVNFLTQEFPPATPIQKEYQEPYWEYMSAEKVQLDSMQTSMEQKQVVASAN